MRERLALITTLSVFILMIIGTIVVGLDAGMACPDWPLCNGKIVPILEGKVIIEYIHRVFSMIVGFLVLANAWVQWKKWRSNRKLQLLAFSTVPLLGIVAFLGGWNVMKQLPSGFTTIDLTVSFLLIAALVILTTASMRMPSEDKKEDVELNKRLQQLFKPALLVTMAVFVQNTFGGFIRHSDAGASYFGRAPVWGEPLIGSQTIAQWLVGIHMFLTFVITITVMWLVFMAVQKKLLKGFAFSLLGLLAAEAAFGLITLVTELAFTAVTIHLAIGTIMLMISIHVAARSVFGTTIEISEVNLEENTSEWHLKGYNDKPEKGY